MICYYAMMNKKKQGINDTMQHIAKGIPIALFCFFASYPNVLAWGFEVHKTINRHAVFTLPYPLFTFYKKHIGYITEAATHPDKRRYVVEGEAANHYIDLDYYDDARLLPRSLDKAIAIHGKAFVHAHGIIPWHIACAKKLLTAAFRQQNIPKILRISADLGHYIADAHVPLHTTKNYNGQFTNQEGIHGLWETRLPTLFKKHYNFFVGTATYIKDVQKSIWEAVCHAHELVDMVLNLERQLSSDFPIGQKFCFEKQGTMLKKVYSEAYAKAYHDLLNGQVEAQMRSSIKMVGDIWFTCWSDAGKPNLEDLLSQAEQNNFDQNFMEEKELLDVAKQLPNIRACGE